MREQLENTNSNCGVGLNIPKSVRSHFDKRSETVELQFDDGTSGTATVKKDSWASCTHLIDQCIGEWARSNGHWETKLLERSVWVYVQIIEDFRVYRVSSQYPFHTPAPGR